MQLLIQRVTQASIFVHQKMITHIQQGILALTCIEQQDTHIAFKKMANKLWNYRLFEDANGKMNQSLADIQGQCLLVPQFTLAADTDKGRRPSFSNVCPNPIAQKGFYDFVQLMRQLYGTTAIKSGIFNADMQVSQTNDGPATFWLHS